jgi:hypothetical protein
MSTSAVSLHSAGRGNEAMTVLKESFARISDRLSSTERLINVAPNDRDLGH